MNERELWIRYRDGELDPAQRERVERRLREEPGFRIRFERLDALASQIGGSASGSFGPFFASRVAMRLRGEAVGRAEGMYEALRWTFARLAVACVLVALLIGAYSAFGTGFGGSIVESMLGLPEATLETALTLGG